MYGSAEEPNNHGSVVTMDYVKIRMKKKDQIEEQIKAYYDVLEGQGVGVSDPLVDAEGFPRADIDLYQIRTARHNIARLQNDHRSVMADIEDALHKLHKAKRGGGGQSEARSESAGDEDALPLCPFARVDAVTPASPACHAGLQVGDEIAQFGSVRTENFQNLQNIADVVRHSEGKPLRVTVVRGGRQAHHVSLTPQRWSGRGLLGCNIVPIHR